MDTATHTADLVDFAQDILAIELGRALEADKADQHTDCSADHEDTEQAAA